LSVDPPLRILIVEDEILIALELESLLQDAGYDPVAIAANSAEAVALGRSLRPDIAFVDIHLADGPTGAEVARALAQGGETKVLFMTANAKRVPSDLAGAWGVISKPYTERIVLDALRFVEERLGRIREGRPERKRACSNGPNASSSWS
jgi:two-component system, response regulator PdtaR